MTTNKTTAMWPENFDPKLRGYILSKWQEIGPVNGNANLLESVRWALEDRTAFEFILTPQKAFDEDALKKARSVFPLMAVSGKGIQVKIPDSVLKKFGYEVNNGVSSVMAAVLQEQAKREVIEKATEDVNPGTIYYPDGLTIEGIETERARLLDKQREVEYEIRRGYDASNAHGLNQLSGANKLRREIEARIDELDALISAVEAPIDPPRTEQEQARADLAGDGVIAPEDEPDIDFGLENKLETAQYDLGLAADTIKDLERQLREAQEELQAEKDVRSFNLKQIETADSSMVAALQRIAELEKELRDKDFLIESMLREAAKAKEDIEEADDLYIAEAKANETLTAERDFLKTANTVMAAVISEQAAKIEALGQAAADGQALMAAAQVFVHVLERAKQTPEATAPIASATIDARIPRPITFGFLDDHNPAAKS